MPLKESFESIRNLRLNNIGLDLELIVEDESFHMHKYLACALSPLLKLKLIGRKKNTIRLRGFSKAAFFWINRLCYDYTISVQDHNLAADVDAALKILDIKVQSITTADNVAFQLKLRQDQFTSMNKSMLESFEKPDFELNTLDGHPIPVHFVVMFLYTKMYRDELQIPADSIGI